MADQRKSDGAAEREELLDELEENHERARREAAGPPEPVEETAEHDGRQGSTRLVNGPIFTSSSTRSIRKGGTG